MLRLLAQRTRLTGKRLRAHGKRARALAQKSACGGKRRSALRERVAARCDSAQAALQCRRALTDTRDAFGNARIALDHRVHALGELLGARCGFLHALARVARARKHGIPILAYNGIGHFALNLLPYAATHLAGGHILRFVVLNAHAGRLGIARIGRGYLLGKISRDRAGHVVRPGLHARLRLLGAHEVPLQAIGTRGNVVAHLLAHVALFVVDGGAFVQVDHGNRHALKRLVRIGV